jgi:hypothetical protein
MLARVVVACSGGAGTLSRYSAAAVYFPHLLMGPGGSPKVLLVYLKHLRTKLFRFRLGTRALDDSVLLPPAELEWQVPRRRSAIVEGSVGIQPVVNK